MDAVTFLHSGWHSSFKGDHDVSSRRQSTGFDSHASTLFAAVTSGLAAVLAPSSLSSQIVQHDVRRNHDFKYHS